MIPDPSAGTTAAPPAEPAQPAVERPRAHIRPGDPARYAVRLLSDGAMTVEGGPCALPVSTTYVDDRRISHEFGQLLPPTLADLVDIAVSVYAADRLCRRRTAAGASGASQWQRVIALSIPVRDPAWWAQSGIQRELQDVLAAFTDDDWSFEYTRREAERPAESQMFLFPTPPPRPATAALFSGGLDSLAGLATWMRDHPDHGVVTFSARTTSRLGHRQRHTLSEVATLYPNRLRNVGVQFGFQKRARHAFDIEERSQRARSFAFQVLGAVTARMAGLHEVLIFENGIGAINLPYSGAQVGSQATRAAHPAVVEALGQFLSLVFDETFTIGLPYVLRTKGELCRSLTGPLEVAIPITVSCDRYPQRSSFADQCGCCPSCLLRRQSLQAAGLRTADAVVPYEHDVFNAAVPRAWERRFYFRAMSGQAYHIEKALSHPDPWAALIAAYPGLLEAEGALLRRGATQPDGVRNDLLDLYRRYVTEWNAFASLVSPGCPERPRSGSRRSPVAVPSPAARVAERESGWSLFGEAEDE